MYGLYRPVIYRISSGKTQRLEDESSKGVLAHTTGDWFWLLAHTWNPSFWPLHVVSFCGLVLASLQHGVWALREQHSQSPGPPTRTQLLLYSVGKSATQPRFKGKGTILICLEAISKEFWGHILKLPQSSLWPHIIYIPPKCKTNPLPTKNIKVPSHNSTRFKFKVGSHPINQVQGRWSSSGTDYQSILELYLKCPGWAVFTQGTHADEKLHVSRNRHVGLK